MNIAFVTLAGGEPALLHNFNDVIQTISDLGFKLIVHTNGALSKEQIQHLSKLNVAYVSFSVDSFDPKINDIGRFKGATESSISKIGEAASQNLPIRISTVITKDNVKGFRSFVEKAEKMNVNLINIHKIEILDHHRERVINNSLLPDEWIVQFKHWMAIAKDTRVFIRAPISYLSPKFVKIIYINEIDCPAKKLDTYSLFPSGKVYRCPYLIKEDIYAWNIKLHNLQHEAPLDNFFFEEGRAFHGKCPVVMKRHNDHYNELLPVCPFIKTTLNPFGGVRNDAWDRVVFNFINELPPLKNRRKHANIKNSSI